ncbi:polysaccharide deacetylase family protein [Brevibacterium oceani]|uniref:polysaccharide deacetylase family protein n=1 Tax=Brevibacterium oceani TaxID=358099 RepID=UPI0015E6A14C|nr:polysaccharide deacetylase [Brevibacterium oceani]
MSLPVMLTFDMDAENLWTARDPKGKGKPVWVSQGTYGPEVGLPRILSLLSRYDLPATFFVPGEVIENHPVAVESILERGHVVEHHSYTHTWSDELDESAEREEFQKGWDAIVSATGRKPKGWRSPAGELTENTITLMEEFGFSYSSNLFDSDTAHWLTDRGRVTDIVELPFAWVLDDAPFFLYSNRLPGRTMAAPSAVVESWIAEFEGLRTEPGTHMLIGMHPQVIGRHSRLTVLEQTVRHILESGDGEFIACEDYAARIRESNTGR